MTSGSSSAPRAVFVDALRLVAAVQMIQGHTLDALLAPAHREGVGFELWTFTRGLTSTTFLFTAGLSFVLASRAARDPVRARQRRLRRAGELLAIGYLMHLPVAMLFGTPAGPAITEFLAVDVLQCIGASLLLLELLTAWLPGRWGRMTLGAGLGAALLLLATPAARLVPVGPARLPLNYLTPAGGSLFPLVPWTGYVLCGLAVGAWLFGQERPVAPRLFGAGLVALLVGVGLARWLPGPDPRTAPGFLVVKLGLVLWLAGLLALGLGRVRRLPPLLASLSGETLFLYVSHVLVLYAAHVGVKARWGGSLSPLSALGVALGLLVLCSAGALGYRRAERALRAARPGGTSAP